MVHRTKLKKKVAVVHIDLKLVRKIDSLLCKNMQKLAMSRIIYNQFYSSRYLNGIAIETSHQNSIRVR